MFMRKIYLKCPYRQNFYFLIWFYIYHQDQWTSAKEKFDLDKMQSRSFKNVQIRRHFGPPFAPVSSFWMSRDVG